MASETHFLCLAGGSEDREWPHQPESGGAGWLSGAVQDQEAHSTEQADEGLLREAGLVNEADSIPVWWATNQRNRHSSPAGDGRRGHHWRIPAADGRNSFPREPSPPQPLSWHLLLNGEHTATPITEESAEARGAGRLILLFLCSWRELQTTLQGWECYVTWPTRVCGLGEMRCEVLGFVFVFISVSSHA